MKKRTAEEVDKEVTELSNGMWWLEKETYVAWTKKCTFRDSIYGNWEASPHNVVYHETKHPERTKNDRKYFNCLSEYEALDRLKIKYGENTKLIKYTVASSPMIFQTDNEGCLTFSSLYVALRHSVTDRKICFEKVLKAVQNKFPELTIKKDSYKGMTGRCVFIHPEGEYVSTPYLVLKKTVDFPKKKVNLDRHTESRQEIIGKRYGRLLVIELAGVDEEQKALAKCICDCGTSTVVRIGNLKNKTKSCGCFRKESNKARGSKDISDLATTSVWNSCKRKHVTELTFEQVKTLIFTKKCFYCERSIDEVGTVYRRPLDDGREIKRLGIDRVDNTKGYLVNNVVVCCTQCNSIKKAYSINSLLSILPNMCKNLKKIKEST